MISGHIHEPDRDHGDVRRCVSIIGMLVDVMLRWVGKYACYLQKGVASPRRLHTTGRYGCGLWLRHVVELAQVDRSSVLPIAAAAAALRQISAIVPRGGEHARRSFSARRLRRGPVQDIAVSSRQSVPIHDSEAHFPHSERAQFRYIPYGERDVNDA